MEEKKRFWEIDALRGAAIIMMVVFHFLFDLNYFSVYPVGVYTGFWWAFARATATVFILLVGISLTLSYSRVRESMTSGQISMKYAIRGMSVFGYGLLITLATWVLLPSGVIVFGVLHFIGVGIMLSRPLLNRKWANLGFGIALICIGIWFYSLRFGFPWLLWLGLRPATFYTLDYFPLLPWLGVMLIGIFIGHRLYPGGRQRIKERSGPVVNQLSWLGRHSLFIYFIHQPILIALLYAVVL